jgi:FdhD protein
LPTHRSFEPVQVVEWTDGSVRTNDDYLAGEEPLEIRVDDHALAVTMRTPGHDEELAAGFLLTERVIENPAELGDIEHVGGSAGPTCNVISVRLQNRAFDPERLRRNFYATSSCGICGKATIEAVRARGLQSSTSALKIDPEVLCQLPARLRAAQQVFGRTGGLHAAALFRSDGELLVAREDIGRHNAVDKIVGWAMLNGRFPLTETILMVSGRGGFEIVQKAAAAGIPVVASVSAPSSLAVTLAREFHLTLIGFLRERRFVIYAGEERCLPASQPALPILGN